MIVNIDKKKLKANLKKDGYKVTRYLFLLLLIYLRYL